MSFIKSSITDTCPHCGGSGEINTPISIPTTNPNYPGYAYDEAVEPCGACNGTGTSDTAPAVCDQIAEEHALITEQKENSIWMF